MSAKVISLQSIDSAAAVLPSLFSFFSFIINPKREGSGSSHRLAMPLRGLVTTFFIFSILRLRFLTADLALVGTGRF